MVTHIERGKATRSPAAARRSSASIALVESLGATVTTVPLQGVKEHVQIAKSIDVIDQATQTLCLP